MVLKKQQEILEHDKYNDFYLKEEVHNKLNIGDTVELKINGVSIVNRTVAFDYHAQVSIIIQEKGALMTRVQQIDAKIAKLKEEKVAEG